MALVSRASILGLALLLGFPLIAGAPRASAAPLAAQQQTSAAGRHKKVKPAHHAPAPITVKVAAGFDELVRTSAWTPVTVTLHNRSSSIFSGTVEIPDSSNNNNGPPLPYHVLYQTAVTLAPGTTKQVVLYMPGSDVGNDGVTVNVRQGRTLVVSTDDTPSTLDDQQLSIGVFTTDPTTTAWLRQDNPLPESPSYVRLTSATLSPSPAALNSFDVIALSNADLAALTSAQLAALTGYVRNGGGLILVGGPAWQETLRGLPPNLIPGRLTGSATVSRLTGLRSLTNARPPHGRTTLSVLTQPAGLVIARQGAIPLAVQMPLGRGQILYLAFDPSVDPLLHWAGAGGMLTDLVRRVAPDAVMRGAMSNGGNNGGPGSVSPGILFARLGLGGPVNIGSELVNVPAAALPSILLFVLLTVCYILLLGPANFLVLRRLHRRELTWVTVPVGALLCLAMTFGVAFHLKGNTVLVNTIGVLQLDGTDGPQPLDQYVGLFAPVRGDYTLTENTSALPSTIPQFQFFYGGSPSSNPVGLRFQEGSQTRVDFLSMNMWSMRSVALQSSVNVTGAIRAQLHVDRQGYIVGAVHNDTHLTLLHPSIIAGTATERIADLPPEATVGVRIKPVNDVLNYKYGSWVWTRMYGQPSYGPGYYGPPTFPLLPVSSLTGYAPLGQGGCCVRSIAFGGGCCYGPAPPQEKTFSDRIRDAAESLPEAQDIADVGEVVFVGWTQQPFGAISVDGAAPQRRDLTLVTAPLQVSFPHGPFTLRTGVLGAHLVDENPQPSQNSCCPQPSEPVILNAGGWAVFAFDIPQAPRITWTRLNLGVDAGGADGADICAVYDWHRHAWVHEDNTYGYTRLRDPARFISPSGTLLVRLRATYDSNTIHINDIHHSLQLSGSGVMT
ncbi:MAG TPA: hypothetical protein VFB58_00575 [Chloroflexota bacterium]|nr:hypothetical protein [Chloroflexota bacterium]